MTCLKPYLTYRKSGLEWFGDTPRHWRVLRLKHAGVSVYGGATPKSDDQANWDGDIVWVTPEDISRTTRIRTSKRTLTDAGLASCSARLVPEGSVVLTSRAPIGNVAIAEVALATNQGCKALVSNGRSLFRPYLYRLLSMAKEELQSRGTGTTFPEVSTSDVAAFETPIPPLDEQRAIADFLDVMDARISRYIAAKRRLIALLEEQKQAMINQAVTRGLDPDVPLKPSGVDWLGDIPAHWEVTRLKYLVEEGGSGIQMGPFGSLLTDITGDQTGYRLYGQENTIRNDFTRGRRWLYEQRYRDLKRYEILEGDLVLTRKGSIGQCRRVPRLPYPGIADSDTIRVRPDIRLLDPDYLQLLMHNASFVSEQVRQTSRGAILAGLNTNTVGNLSILLPTLDEQSQILSWCEAANRPIDRTGSLARGQIDNALAYRTRLISDVVTGKLDVRGVELPAVEGYVDAGIEDAMDGSGVGFEDGFEARDQEAPL